MNTIGKGRNQIERRVKMVDEGWYGVMTCRSTCYRKGNELNGTVLSGF